MSKKISLALIAIFVLALSSTVLFAQGPNITDETIKTFLQVYADPTPDAVAKATADLGADKIADFTSVNTKITTLYGLSASNVTGDALKATAAQMPAPYTISAEEVDVYEANADAVKDALSKYTSAAMPK
jgi:hypothetical protein